MMIQLVKNYIVMVFLFEIKEQRLIWWINFFKDFVDCGLFLIGDVFYVECIWFCFVELIQYDLDFVKFYWNIYYIWYLRYEIVFGKLEEFYYFLEIFGVLNYLYLVFFEKLDEVRLKCKVIDFNNDFQQYLNYVLFFFNVLKFFYWKEVLSLFFYLMKVVVQELFDFGLQLIDQ